MAAVTSCCQLLQAAASFDSCCQLWQLLQAVARFDKCYKLLQALTSCEKLCPVLTDVKGCPELWQLPLKVGTWRLKISKAPLLYTDPYSTLFVFIPLIWNLLKLWRRRLLLWTKLLQSPISKPKFYHKQFSVYEHKSWFSKFPLMWRTDKRNSICYILQQIAKDVRNLNSVSGDRALQNLSSTPLNLARS